VQIAEYDGGRRKIVAHVGSAHTEAELGILLERAREMLADPAQGAFDLGIEPAVPQARLVTLAVAPTLFDAGPTGEVPVAGPARVVSTDSRVLFQALDGVFRDLGFGALGDEVFRDLVLARVVEPTSILDAGRVLADLGRKAASDKTMRRTLARCADRGYRDKIAGLCFAHALASGDVSLVLYDVTTLYFEAEHEDALRKVGYSKERRVDPQVVVGLLVDRHGFPLEIGCFEGSKAEKHTILPVIRQFQARHGIEAMVVVISGAKAARTPRFVRTDGGARALDEKALARARKLAGLKGYVTNLPVTVMPPGEVISRYHDLWHVEQSFRMSKTDLAARPMFVRTRDAIEAHLTIVFTALAVARETQNRTGLAIRNVIRQLRPLRSATIAVNGAVQAFPPAIDPEQQKILDDLKNAQDLRH
jgi:hypothetical protein